METPWPSGGTGQLPLPSKMMKEGRGMGMRCNQAQEYRQGRLGGLCRLHMTAPTDMNVYKGKACLKSSQLNTAVLLFGTKSLLNIKSF